MMFFQIIAGRNSVEMNILLAEMIIVEMISAEMISVEMIIVERNLIVDVNLTVADESFVFPGDLYQKFIF